MLENIEVLCHSSIKINKEKIIYIDPFKINENFNDAYIVFITHSHYDHYSKEDINKIKKDDTKIIAPKETIEKLLQEGYKQETIIAVEPNKEYKVEGIKFETISAYNIDKQFHPKENEWVGYIIELQGIRYYIAGDTDINEEDKKVKCDVAFVPVGGTYTMNYKEAANFINEIKPKIAVPIHYGSVVGTKQDAINFIGLVESNIRCEILIKE